MPKEGFRDFHCDDCGRTFSLLIDPGKDKTHTCPNCESDHVEPVREDEAVPVG